MKQAQKTLIVEDSDLQAEYLEEILNDLGIRNVTKAADGIIGLECFKRALQEKSIYSLVFIDIVMPGMDGQELLKHVRAMEKDAGMAGIDRSIIIMTTALNTPNDMMEAIIVGDCDDYIVKPVDQDILGAKLRKYKLLV